LIRASFDTGALLTWLSGQSAHLIGLTQKVKRKYGGECDGRNATIGRLLPAGSEPARSFGHNPHGRGLPDRAQPDQGPAQEAIAEMAWLLRDTRGSMFLGGAF
jgi:hypothetical protein